MLGNMIEDDVRLSSIIKEFERAVGLWGDGDRSLDVCEVLARGKAISDRVGMEPAVVPRPLGANVDEWHKALSVLVDAHLGDCRCLNCWDYFNSDKAPTLGLTGMIRCPHCGSHLWEPIGEVDA